LVFRFHEQTTFDHEQTGEIHSFVVSIGRAISLKTVDSHLGWRVIVPAGFGVQRFVVATVAISLATKERLAALGGLGIEIHAWFRYRRSQRKLIIMQRRQFRSYLIILRWSRDVS